MCIKDTLKEYYEYYEHFESFVWIARDYPENDNTEFQDAKYPVTSQQKNIDKISFINVPEYNRAYFEVSDDPEGDKQEMVIYYFKDTSCAKMFYYLNGSKTSVNDFPSSYFHQDNSSKVCFSWYNCGRLHRVNGPSKIFFDIKTSKISSTVWFNDGVDITKDVSKFLSNINKNWYELDDDELLMLQMEFF